MVRNKILIVEDDRTLLGVLKYSLIKEGFAVSTAVDGVKAIETARRQRPDLILLDVMLPELDGLEVCRTLRKEMTAPILMLTARAEEIDRVVGLELGADDYLTKPFSMRELLARVRAMLRRRELLEEEMRSSSSLVRAGDIELDADRHLVSVKGAALTLSPKEFELLAFLIRNRGHVFNRDQLLGKIWGYDYFGDSRTVDVHMRWLRKHLEADPAHPQHLLTVRGVGYKFEE
ncbi:MAG: response regulator transcription factor [Chloroflexi bacterium]|nr:response regulator transcription factor [Chloroflexota bacterium]